MVVDYKDLENFTTCPRKFYLSRGQEPFYSSTFEDLLFVGFSLENPVVEAEVEGMKLIARPDLVVKEQGGWKIVLKKRAKSSRKNMLWKPLIMLSCSQEPVLLSAGLRFYRIVSHGGWKTGETWCPSLKISYWR